MSTSQRPNSIQLEEVANMLIKEFKEIKTRIPDLVPEEREIIRKVLEIEDQDLENKLEKVIEEIKPESTTKYQELLENILNKLKEKKEKCQETRTKI